MTVQGYDAILIFRTRTKANWLDKIRSSTITSRIKKKQKYPTLSKILLL